MGEVTSEFTRGKTRRGEQCRSRFKGIPFQLPYGTRGLFMAVALIFCTTFLTQTALAVVPEYFLSITTSQIGDRGIGQISVTPGYGCTGACTQLYPSGTAVTLAPLPVPGAVFTGWTGCDSVADNICTVNMITDKNIVAGFVSERGGISGQVKDIDGNGASNVYVRAIPALGINFSVGAWPNQFTDSNGFYNITNLYPGEYRVTFQRQTSSGQTSYYLISEYYNHEPNTASADKITVNANVVSGIDGTIPPGGSISGTLTDNNGNGIYNGIVRVYNHDDQNIGQALTDASGNYRVIGVPTGSYKLRFFGATLINTGPNLNNFIKQSSASFVPVTAPGETAGINAILMPGGTISGTVTDSRGRPIGSDSNYRSQYISVYDLNGESVGSRTTTDSTGAYTIRGLPTGTYKILFDTAYNNRNSGGFSPPNYTSQYYGNKADFATADLVSATINQDTPNINAVLSPSGPFIFSTPPAKDFGAQAANASTIRSFTIFNGGTADLILGSLTISGSDFEILNDGCSGVTLAATGECPFVVSFSSTTEGSKTATISIPSNDPATSVLSVLVKGAVGTLTGTSGTSPVPYGDNVAVAPTPDVQLTFSAVSSAESEVSVTAISTPAAPAPANFKLLNGASFEIATSAAFSGPVSVCINYKPGSMSNPANEQNLKLFHYEGLSWKDITTSVDTVAKKICGITTSFSPFAIAEPSTYTITVNQTANGSITGYTFSGFNAGYTQTYNITPNAGYHIDTLTVDGSSAPVASSYTFSDIQANHAITATFAANPTYRITASSTGSGSITPAGDTILLGGLSQTCIITPAAGNRIDKLTVDGGSKNPATSYGFYNISANHTIDVSFVPDTYTIATTVSGSGSITPAGTTTVTGGGSQSYAITPAAGFKIVSVTVDGASVSIAADNTYAFTNVRANHTIAASLVPITFTVTVAQTANGSISPYTFSGFTAGSSRTYSITPATGYHVETLTVDGQPVTPAASFTINNIQADHSITATFAANPTYTITANSGANGSITSPGDTTLQGGVSKSYTITPAVGYRVDKVLVDGVNKGAITSYSFTSITADHTIDASFIKDEYVITAGILNGSGSITPAGITTVNSGGSQSYIITPAAGYKIASVAVNGVSKGAVTSYTFTNVRASYSITVTFVPITYTITVTQTANGSISPFTYSGFTAGMNRSYTIIPKTGYRIDTLTVDGVLQAPAPGYTFTNIQTNHSITATFVPLP